MMKSIDLITLLSKAEQAKVSYKISYTRPKRGLLRRMKRSLDCNKSYRSHKNSEEHLKPK